MTTPPNRQLRRSHPRWRMFLLFLTLGHPWRPAPLPALRNNPAIPQPPQHLTHPRLSLLRPPRTRRQTWRRRLLHQHLHRRPHRPLPHQLPRARRVVPWSSLLHNRGQQTLESASLTCRLATRTRRQATTRVLAFLTCCRTGTHFKPDTTGFPKTCSSRCRQSCRRQKQGSCTQRLVHTTLLSFASRLRPA